MYVKFDYTEDDLVNAGERFLARSKSVRSARVRGVVYSLAAGAVVGLAAAVYIGVWTLAVSAAVMLYMIGFQQLTYWKSMRKRLRKIVREQHGRFGTNVCEVELTPVGVCVRQCKTQVTYEWEVVGEVLETPDAVEIYTRHGGGVIVRARAFGDAAERGRFVELAEGYLGLSRAGDDRGALAGEEVGGGIERGR
ncbi:MAG: hypothetical protein JOZ02_16815 [Acidobacteria bacterium]|nr:hypothetical protein [Acidobacteriota bacterium]